MTSLTVHTADEPRIDEVFPHIDLTGEPPF
ncbi:hypothetical protein M2280_005232 [Prescottella agglutinans]|uniref:Uncharacterized protein n=1 Tax=Prescottella agglutinans TaxID=1644129 RepID=A0ABT6MI18_9NOCA|nr:hypothetical protein [Prescottella agglutinans]